MNDPAGLWFSSAYDRRERVDVRIFGPHGPVLGRLEVIDDGKRYGWHFLTVLGRHMNPGIGERTVWRDITGIVADNFREQIGSPSPAPPSRLFRVGSVYQENFPAPAKRYRDCTQYGLDLGVLVQERAAAGWADSVYVSSNGSPLGNRIQKAVGHASFDLEWSAAAEALHNAWQGELAPSEPN